jgi:site-specific DNA recombinase
MRAAIYARISLDKDGEGSGVERQLEDCRKLIADRGWTLVEEYVDNDVSAFSGKRRPEFERMLAGDFDTLVVWRTDRLARRGKDLQRFLDKGATLTSCTEPEFTGSTGLLMLRILAGFAEHESGVKSERVARKMRQKREKGDPHAGGKRCFGYTRDGMTVVPEEAALIREAAQRILAGETVGHVLLDWQARGLDTTRSGSNFKRLLTSERLVALPPATWPPILDMETWERLRSVLQVKKGMTPRRFLLTGLLYCGKCGGPMAGSGESYRCLSVLRGGCGGLSVRAAAIEARVTELALARIPTQKVEGETENQVEGLLQALRQVEADIGQLAKDHYVEKRISRPAYMGANDELERRAAQLREQIADQATGEDHGTLDEIQEAWPHQSLSWRQSVLRTVLDRIVCAPATSTRQPASERLRLFWRA